MLVGTTVPQPAFMEGRGMKDCKHDKLGKEVFIELGKHLDSPNVPYMSACLNCGEAVQIYPEQDAKQQ